MLIPANKEEGTPGPVRPDLCKKAIEPETGSEAVKFKSGTPPPAGALYVLSDLFFLDCRTGCPGSAKENDGTAVIWSGAGCFWLLFFT